MFVAVVWLLRKKVWEKEKYIENDENEWIFWFETLNLVLSQMGYLKNQ